MLTAAVVMTALVVWVLFFYGVPGDAGQVPR